MFLKNLKITTIDSLGTRKREDGFSVNLTTGDIYLVTLIPNKELCFFDAIAEAIHKQQPKRLARFPFFSPEETGLSKEKARNVLILKMESPDYDQAVFCLGTAIIRKSFTFEEAEHCNDDAELQIFNDYVQKELNRKVIVQEIVSLANWKINNSAQSAMKNTEIPYLCHHQGKISIAKGFCMVNKPLRDAVSLINIFQLEHFLKTGTFLFSRDELFDLTEPTKKFILPKELTTQST